MPDSPISKDTLEYLAGLARIELDPQEEKKLLKDLQNILSHVSELRKADTAGVEPMNGGTDLVNVFREDAERHDTNLGHGPQQFPDKEKEFLKIPPVFGRAADDAGNPE